MDEGNIQLWLYRLLFLAQVHLNIIMNIYMINTNVTFQSLILHVKSQCQYGKHYNTSKLRHLPFSTLNCINQGSRQIQIIKEKS
jgi:hypothetical protein